MMTTKQHPKRAPVLSILLLIVAGETVFLLPFVLARVFKPTLLEAFNINNTELGFLFSVYGIVAAVSYLFGGPLADRFPPRILIGTALILTSLGGFVYATYPSYTVLLIIYGYWGMTTIFLFWAALIKATRLWGGTRSQGKAFGFLDGGRGIISALIGIFGVLIFSTGIEGDVVQSTQEREMAFRDVIIACSIFIAVVGVGVMFLLKSHDTGKENSTTVLTKKNVSAVLRMPQLWYLMLIIICGYSGYKITENFPLYAREVLNYSETDSAKIGTFLLFFRPVVGIGLGLLADRTKASKYLVGGFIFIIVGSAFYAFGVLQDSVIWLFFVSTLVLSLGIYAARVLYFALLEEARFPIALTGTVVGLVSVIGYTPDIFIGPVTGYYLDTYPGLIGHQITFGMIAVFGLIGLVATILFVRSNRRTSEVHQS